MPVMSTVSLLQCSECSNIAEFTSMQLIASLTVVFFNESSQPENLHLPGLQCGHEWKNVVEMGRMGDYRHWIENNTAVLEIQQGACHGCVFYQSAICYCLKIQKYPPSHSS